MHKPATTKGKLSAADRSDRDRAAGLAVDPNRLREIDRPRLAAGIKQVATGRIALEIDQMEDAVVISHRLRLNPAIGRRNHDYPARFVGCPGRRHV